MDTLFRTRSLADFKGQPVRSHVHFRAAKSLEALDNGYEDLYSDYEGESESEGGSEGGQLIIETGTLDDHRPVPLEAIVEAAGSSRRRQRIPQYNA
ncbi:hypothetical protein BYT27DRAFT_7253417 [Phlegmacium glaucopus]|nr:hypothetical protein BYT27DRAFT_7253417 [Phlegmacium glaucopus]